MPWKRSDEITQEEWDSAALYALRYPDDSWECREPPDSPDPEFGLTTRDLDGNDGAVALALIVSDEQKNGATTVWHVYDKRPAAQGEQKP